MQKTKFKTGKKMQNNSESQIMLVDYIRYISNMPDLFFQEPRMIIDAKSASIGLNVDALVQDTLEFLTGQENLEIDWLNNSQNPFLLPANEKNKNYLAFVAMATYSLNYPGFSGVLESVSPVKIFLIKTLQKLSTLMPASVFFNDQDRREELARLSIQALSILPVGESASVAGDRLKALDSVERMRLLKESQEIQRRNEELRKKREAEEMASKWNRE